MKNYVLISVALLLAYFLAKNNVPVTVYQSGVILSKLNRGEKLNNPFNIEKSANAWQGLAPDQLDSRFATFISPEYGIRAWAKLISTYYKTYGLNTVSKIINRYAPSTENDTSSYINTVAKMLGIPANQQFDLTETNLFKLANAMMLVEQGRVIYTPEIIKRGIALAGVA